MKRLALLAALALTACGNQPASDGYVFDKPEWTQSVMSVEVIHHPDIAALQRAAPAATMEQVRAQDRSLMAWGVVNKDGRCTLHVVDPEKKYAPEWIGHELAHCMYGRFHA